MRPEPRRFIAANLPLAPVPSVPEIRLHMAHAGSGLRRLVERRGSAVEPAPYWAHVWAGGAVLARHLLRRPETVTGRRVLDLGAGSGIVAIAAAMAGASAVMAAEIDSVARAAIAMNAAANAVPIAVIAEDLTAGLPPGVDLVAVGDLFYERGLAERVTHFLDRCLAAGLDVLIGDPGRAYLPVSRLQLVAEYPVSDVGDPKGAPPKLSAVFSFRPEPPLGL